MHENALRKIETNKKWSLISNSLMKLRGKSKEWRQKLRHVRRIFITLNGATNLFMEIESGTAVNCLTSKQSSI